jgi:hypothetical protein
MFEALTPLRTKLAGQRSHPAAELRRIEPGSPQGLYEAPAAAGASARQPDVRSRTTTGISRSVFAW